MQRSLRKIDERHVGLHGVEKGVEGKVPELCQLPGRMALGDDMR